MSMPSAEAAKEMLTPDPRQTLMGQKSQSIRNLKRSSIKFDISNLPEDAQRVYHELKKTNGEEYALTCIFIMRTAIELHRAWHMTLLTTKILSLVKEKFNIIMTWELGVIKLKFRFNDGAHELHRKVPYDYDSEYQDIYLRIAVALVEGHITVDEALEYQRETKKGEHTAKSGLYIRDFPGRLIVYPLLSMSCAVIFFGGDWYDGGIAALTGISTGLIEYFLAEGLGGEAKVLIDIVVGTVTGIITSLFFRFDGGEVCFPAVFLGTLYWYFYGTAFVIGLLEVIAGELETGVTRFIAVSVKTFVLCLGASFGMLLTLEDPFEAWYGSSGNCGLIDLDSEWWRIPLYLLSSAAALAQYRFPVAGYWRGLLVQLVGYEVQYQIQKHLQTISQSLDLLDAAASNVMGAAAAVCTASLLSWIIDQIRYYYYGRVLQRDDEKINSSIGKVAYSIFSTFTKCGAALGLGRDDDVENHELGRKLRQQSGELQDPNHPRQVIELTPVEDRMIVELLIDSQDHNIWAVLMPAVYQLVPGSVIARMWFEAIFPPRLNTIDVTIPGTDFTITTLSNEPTDDVFANLMVISASLALGLIVGFALVQGFEFIFCGCGICEDTATDIYGGATGSRSKKRGDLRGGMYTSANEDPADGQDKKGTTESAGAGKTTENRDEQPPYIDEIVTEAVHI